MSENVQEATPLMELTQRMERLEKKVLSLSLELITEQTEKMLIRTTINQLKSDIAYRLDNVTITLEDAPCP